MGKLYYKKAAPKRLRKFLKALSLLIVVLGLSMSFYVFFPLVSWQIYFAPAFASQDLAVPIPNTIVVNNNTIQSLISEAANNLSGIDYTNADNWYPNYKVSKGTPSISSYSIAIPKLKIKDATVSTIDDNLALHLVNFGGTAIPPEKGNAVIFGHSTLPWLFDPSNYKTIFADAYELKIGDEIDVNISGATYKYKIYNITVVSPDDTSVLEQDYSDSFLTLITCTPPGTTWKRLIIRSRIEKI